MKPLLRRLKRDARHRFRTTFRRPRDPQTLTVFVHVPKTGGTSVAKILPACGVGETTCRRWVHRPEYFVKIASRSDWIEGHVSQEQFQTLLAPMRPRNIRYFGLIREPAMQLASHYNWLIHIANSDTRKRNAHSQGIIRLADRLAESDNSDPARVIANLLSNRALFLNLQSRLLIGDAASGDRSARDSRRSGYTCLTTTDRIKDLVVSITGDSELTVPHANAVPYHFDKAIFRTPELRRFMNKENRLDQILWQDLNGG